MVSFSDRVEKELNHQDVPGAVLHDLFFETRAFLKLQSLIHHIYDSGVPLRLFRKTAINERQKKLLLVGKIRIDRPFGIACLRSNLINRGRIVTSATGYVESRV